MSGLDAVPGTGSSVGPVEATGLDVGLDAAGDLVADAPALGDAGAEVVGGDADRGGRDGMDRTVRGAEGGECGHGDAGAVDHDEGGQLGDLGGSPPKGELGEAV